MKELVLKLVELECLKFSPKDPFTYASGLKGPIYCDNRMIISHPEVRSLVAKGFDNIIKESHLKYDHIAGVATAGIPHAAFLSEVRHESMVYVRSKPKGHGQGRMVEGDVSQGQKLLLVEDLVNQGSSIAKVIEGVRERGFVVDSAVCIVDYRMEKARKVMESLKVDLFSLISFFDLADIILEENVIDREGYELLLDWHKDPTKWS